MSKVLFCGDIHNKARRILPRVDEVIDQRGINRVVFLGDYVDEFNEGSKKIIDSTLYLADWVKDKRSSSNLTVNVLMGNHDLPYVVAYQDLGYYQVRDSVAVPHHSSARYKLRDIMREMIDSVAVYINYQGGGVIASHAGFVESWSSKLGHDSIEDLVNKTNNLYRQDYLYMLSWAGRERGGSDLPSPCWTGEHELIEGAVHGITQVVGHTPQAGIIKCSSAGGDDLWFCDTHSWPSERQRGDGSMLMLDTSEGEFEVVSPGNWNRFE
jgi:hypothetical protein